MTEENTSEIYIADNTSVIYKDETIFHPGHYVKGWIEDSGYDEKSIAVAMDMPESELEMLEKGFTDLDEELMEKLSEVTGAVKSLWRYHQKTYDDAIKKISIKRDKDCRFISVDASTKKTALSLFINGELKAIKLIDCSFIPDEEKRVEVMSRYIYRWLDNIGPAIVYIEDTAVTRDARTQRMLTRIQGVVYTYCIFHDCEFNTIIPSSWRKYAGINQTKGMKREELKRQAVEKVKELYNIDVSDDAAESVLIGEGVIKIFDEREQKK